MIQLQVLNKILNDQDASIITLNNLNSDYFSDYQNEFWFIKNHLDTYGNIPDQTTFLDKFPGFEVLKVTETPSYLLSELVKDKNKRFLAENFNKIRNYILNDEVDSALNLLREASEKTNDAVSLQSTDILEDTSRYDSYLEKTKNREGYFIPTGFPELDKILGGWDVKEELGIIAARTGVGKSWLLLKCASAAAEAGYRVGIYSGEMSINKVGYRVDTLIGHISNGALVHGNDSIKNEYRQYIENIQNKKIKGCMKVITPRDINGPAGVSALRAFIEKDKLDILFIDQHSLLEDDRKAKNPIEKAANISKDLKLLQVIKQMPIIAVSQLNREKVEVFDTTQLAQSDRIGQDCTLALYIERKNDLFIIHIVKARDGGDGTKLTYRVDLNRGTFTFIPDEQSGESSYEDSGYSEDEVF